MAKRKARARKRCPDPKKHPPAAKRASRSGSNAGRGFRYQDAVSARLAIATWAHLRSPATVIPEGGDDVELRGEETTFIQVKSRSEHLGDYPVGDAARYVEELWARGRGSSRVPDRLGIILERNVAGMPPIGERSNSLATGGPLAERFSDDQKTDEMLWKTSIVVAPMRWASAR